MSHNVDEGDIVTVEWTDGQSFDARVLHMPCDCGDMIYVRRLDVTQGDTEYAINPSCKDFVGLFKDKDKQEQPK